MSESIGASEVMNPPPPATPEAATVRMQELKDDAGFMERVANKDAAAFEEYNRA